MKTLGSFLVAGVAVAQMFAASPPPGRDVRIDAKVNYPVLLPEGGRVYLRLALHTPKRERPSRNPVNMAIVLDRSGSMAAEGKMEHARAAVGALVDQLRPNDILSLVVYDDVVDVLRPASRVGSSSGEITSLLREVYPRGWTNLGAGMNEGFAQARANIKREYTNRVVLLSDGLANQGITAPDRLADIARRYRTRGISLSTIGVGLEYDENLLVALSENGGGNYYYLESARNLASVLRQEFERLSSVVAQNAVIEIRLGRGVALHDVIGCGFEQKGGDLRIAVGDLYGDDTREIIVELDVPRGTGSFTIAEGRLTSDWSADGGTISSSFASEVRYNRDAGKVERERDLNVQGRADIAVSTRTVDQAMEEYDRGNTEQASDLLAGARAGLLASPAVAQPGAAGEALREQANRLNAYADTLKDERSDARRVKKGIQFDNYKTRKQR